MTPPAFVTPVHAAFEDGDRVTLPSGKRVTAIPIADIEAPPVSVLIGDTTYLFQMRARFRGRREAAQALEALGLVFPSIETVREIARVGLWIEPCFLVFNQYDQRHMQTREYCEKHDRTCWERIIVGRPGPIAELQSLPVVMNFGKWHVAGAAPFNNRLGGWQTARGGRFTQLGVADNHIGQVDLHDYGTLTMGEEPDASRLAA